MGQITMKIRCTLQHQSFNHKYGLIVRISTLPSSLCLFFIFNIFCLVQHYSSKCYDTILYGPGKKDTLGKSPVRSPCNHSQARLCPTAQALVGVWLPLPSRFSGLVTSEWSAATELGKACAARQGPARAPLAGDKRALPRGTRLGETAIWPLPSAVFTSTPWEPAPISGTNVLWKNTDLGKTQKLHSHHSQGNERSAL